MAKKVTLMMALQDRYSGTMKKAKKTTSDFQKTVKKAAIEMDKANRKKLEARVDNSKLLRGLRTLKAKLNPLTREKVIKFAAKIHNVKRKLVPLMATLKKLSLKPVIITVKLKNLATGMIGGIKNALGRLFRFAALGMGAAAAGIGYAMRQGMELEDYGLTMKHFIGVGKPSASKSQVEKEANQYMDWLRHNANVTPFSTADVMAAGSRAAQITEGNIEAAKGFVKMAENMAAVTPGKRPIDAMEALADAMMGEFERMKEFGFKLSKKNFDEAGGDLFKALSSTGKTLEQTFDGGAGEKAKSASGLWSTVLGNIQSGIATGGLAVLAALKPTLKLAVKNSEEVNKFFGDLGEKIGVWLRDHIPGIIEGAKKAWKLLSEWVGDKWERLAPFRGKVSEWFRNALDGKGGTDIFSTGFGLANSFIDKLIEGVNDVTVNWDTKYQPVIDKITTSIKSLFDSIIGIYNVFFKKGENKEQLSAPEVVQTMQMSDFGGRTNYYAAAHGVKSGMTVNQMLGVPANTDTLQTDWQAKIRELNEQAKKNPVAVETNIKPDTAGIEKMRTDIRTPVTVPVVPSINGRWGGTPSPKGHAAGIKRVPWDNYPALLHKGETVLPSGEAAGYRAAGNRMGGGNNITLTVNVNGGSMDERGLARYIVGELQSAALNMG